MGLDLKGVDLPLGLNVWYALGLSHVLGSGSVPYPSGSFETSNLSRTSGFPEPWSRILQQYHPPCATVWTYWQLPCDLATKHPSPRKQLFRNIRTSLGWPETEVVFWPVSAEGPQRLQARTDLFWQGMAHFQPRYVILFGWRVFRELFPRMEGSKYGLFKHSQITYIFLPGPEDMLPDQKQAKNFVWTTLKAITL